MSSSYPIPADALDDRFAWVGTSGSGKTYNAGAGVEQLLASGARVVIVDPLDVWWGLRLRPDGRPSKFPVVIFGGAHGDLPLNEQAGALIGETVATMAESCIVSLGGIGTRAAEIRFMLAFLSALYRHTPVGAPPMHLVLDEADMWAPQQERDKGEGPKLLGMTETIVRRGRVRGFIPWLITQRPAVLNKNVLSQVDGLVAMKLTSSQDRDAIGDWVKGQADVDQWKAIWSELPTMARGEGIIWAPGRGILERAAFPPKATFDSSRTPTRGERIERVDLKPLDLDRLKGRLATIEDEAKANDPTALRAEVARLTRALAAAERAAGKAAAPVTVVANAEEVAEARRAGEVTGFAIGLARARAAIDAVRVEPAAVGDVPVPAARPARLARRAEAAPIQQAGSVPAGCAKPLAALAAVYPSGLTEPQWATSAGYKRSGGTWGTYKSRLRGAGLIEQREGRWFATDSGASAVGDVELPPPPGPDLVRWWAEKLPGTSKIAEALIAAWPRALSKDELAAAIGMSASGGSFGTYLSRLAGPGLIDRSDGIRLSSEVMA